MRIILLALVAFIACIPPAQQTYPQPVVEPAPGDPEGEPAVETGETSEPAAEGDGGGFVPQRSCSSIKCSSSADCSGCGPCNTFSRTCNTF